MGTVVGARPMIRRALRLWFGAADDIIAEVKAARDGWLAILIANAVTMCA
jgi:hypothetical protein